MDPEPEQHEHEAAPEVGGNGSYSDADVTAMMARRVYTTSTPFHVARGQVAVSVDPELEVEARRTRLLSVRIDILITSARHCLSKGARQGVNLAEYDRIELWRRRNWASGRERSRRDAGNSAPVPGPR
jgi:hypothetical protein